MMQQPHLSTAARSLNTLHLCPDSSQECIYSKELFSNWHYLDQKSLLSQAVLNWILLQEIRLQLHGPRIYIEAALLFLLQAATQRRLSEGQIWLC